PGNARRPCVGFLDATARQNQRSEFQLEASDCCGWVRRDSGRHDLWPLGFLGRLLPAIGRLRPAARFADHDHRFALWRGSRDRRDLWPTVPARRAWVRLVHGLGTRLLRFLVVPPSALVMSFY